MQINTRSQSIIISLNSFIISYIQHEKIESNFSCCNLIFFQVEIHLYDNTNWEENTKTCLAYYLTLSPNPLFEWIMDRKSVATKINIFLFK